MRSHEQKVFSQNGEDRILLYIFSAIGVKHHQFLKLGIGNGRECNTANLSIHFGWREVRMEGNPALVATAQMYYRNRLIFKAGRVNIAKVFVTADNINDSITKNGLSGEIDFLSIDIDGNDYWVWKAISVINPRVVIIEYNASFTVDRSITVKYDPRFDRRKTHPTGWYHGASLAALNALGKVKGYSLVGCNSDGCNAFFVRDDCVGDNLPVTSVREAFYPHMIRNLDSSLDYEVIKDMSFVEVS